MAINENDILVSPPGVSYSQRLFSEEVALAMAASGQVIVPNEPGYEFSNGRRFDTGPGPYENS